MIIKGRNPVVSVLDSLFGASPDEEDASGGLLAWLVFRVARSGTNREGGFTEAQLSQFVEDGEIGKTEDASKYLGYVASETLAKYGVDRLARTVGPERAEKSIGKKRAEASVDADDAPTREPGFNPFRALNDGLQKLRGKK